MSIESEQLMNSPLTDTESSITTLVGSASLKSQSSNSFYLSDDLLIKYCSQKDKNLTVVPIDKEAPSYHKYIISK